MCINHPNGCLPLQVILLSPMWTFFVLSHASPWAAKPVCSLDAGVVLQAAPALVGSEHPQEGFEVSPGYKLQTAALKGMHCPSLHCPFISTVLSVHHSS